MARYLDGSKVELGRDASSYAWRIDRDLLEDDAAAGTVGPRGVDPELVKRLESGDGERFRLLDDDGEVYYVGRLVADVEEDLAHPEGFDFAPLDDFGGGAGCTMIEWRVLAGAMVWDGRQVRSYGWKRS